MFNIFELPPDPGPASNTTFEGEQPWQLRGLCKGLSFKSDKIFFPQRGGNTKQAKKLCGRCPVRTDCLSYALDTNQRFGIWGGMSERERKTIQRNRRRTA